METITITKEYYEFLLEKTKERCELYSENKFLRYKLGETKFPTTEKEWLLYHDFIKHKWFFLGKEENYEDEMELAKIMARRTEEQQQALEEFQKMNKERENG